jgi:hypothetical protein
MMVFLLNHSVVEDKRAKDHVCMHTCMREREREREREAEKESM